MTGEDRPWRVVVTFGDTRSITGQVVVFRMKGARPIASVKEVFIDSTKLVGTIKAMRERLIEQAQVLEQLQEQLGAEWAVMVERDMP